MVKGGIGDDDDERKLGDNIDNNQLWLANQDCYIKFAKLYCVLIILYIVSLRALCRFICRLGIVYCYSDYVLEVCHK